MRTLLVEDERSAARMIAKGLREHGYAVDLAADGAAAMQHIENNGYEIVILDVMLPALGGLDVCREIRARGLPTAVLMLTARDGIEDRVAGLDAGADDYLTKPFHFSELLARLRALARRRSSPVLPESLSCGRLHVNMRSHEVRVDADLVELTAREYALLEYLCRKEGAVVGRQEIAERVWDDRYDPCSNVIDVYIQRLRRKLDRGPRSFIRTRRGAGYQLIGTPDASA
jgi:two-component system copper resistance phosphate regulon response regulator CusR